MGKTHTQHPLDYGKLFFVVPLMALSREVIDRSRGKAYLEAVGLEWGCEADLQGYSLALPPT